MARLVIEAVPVLMIAAGVALLVRARSPRRQRPVPSVDQQTADRYRQALTALRRASLEEYHHRRI